MESNTKKKLTMTLFLQGPSYSKATGSEFE